jgi:hypothetical protein
MEKAELVTISKSINQDGEVELVYEATEINPVPVAVSDRERIEQLETALAALLAAQNNTNG